MLNTRDPFNAYGFGIVTMFNLIRALILAFALASFVAIVMMMVNSRGYGYGLSRKLNWTNFLVSSSIGNIGFQKSTCLFQPLMDLGARSINCDSGNLDKLIYAGIVPDYFDEESPYNLNFCGNPADQILIQECSG